MEILNNLSWGDYFTGIGILLACYYIGVAAICYRTEINNLILGSGKEETTEGGDTTAPAPDEISELTKKALHEINSILETAGKEAGKPELLMQLRQVLASYPGIRVPAYKNAVFDYIIREAKQICGVGISAAELEG